MGELRILHRVPLVGQRVGASLPFSQWIPEDEASAITVEGDGMRIAVSVDRTCVDSMHDDITDELISRSLNIRVVVLLVEVVVADIPDDLGAFIVEKERWPKGEDIIKGGGVRPLLLVFCDGLRNRGPRPFPASFSFKGFFRHQAVRT